MSGMEAHPYLRLKVSRSSFALRRSPTENVALPRKLLCRYRTEKKKKKLVNKVSNKELNNKTMTEPFFWYHGGVSNKHESFANSEH